LLQDIGGGFGVAANPQRNRINQAFVTPHELLPGSLIAFNAAPDQIAVARVARFADGQEMLRCHSGCRPPQLPAITRRFRVCLPICFRSSTNSSARCTAPPTASRWSRNVPTP